ncbi:MAG TPA: nitroreductase family protein [Oscillospiraceae bacterium]|nr:nitroreductase family protein [Oscillospiraceae bacterium]
MITIAFGYAEGELCRENLDQINRKSIDQICLVKPQNDFVSELVQAIRIAPSGINRQPWRIEPDNDSIHFYCEQPSFLTPVNSNNLKGLMPGAILKRMQGISCGAAIAHFLICAEHFGKNITFSRLQGKEKSHKKLTYLLSAIIEEK